MNDQVRDLWQERYAKHEDSYRELLSFDLFEDWEHNHSPEVLAEDEFRCGLEARLGGNREQARSFMERALLVADRALKEKPLERGLSKVGYPRNRGELLRIREYSAGLLGGEVDSDALVAASCDFCAAVSRYSEWDSQAEAYYLAAIRVAFIGNDRMRAQLLLSKAPKFHWHWEEAQALSKLMSDETRTKSDGLAELDSFMDRLRDPDYNPGFFFEATVARLEVSEICEAVRAGRSTPDLAGSLERIAKQ